MRFVARNDSGVSIAADEGTRREYDEIFQRQTYELVRRSYSNQ
jgi:hypothetical protein